MADRSDGAGPGGRDGSRAAVRRLVESRGFQITIIALILVNAAVLGLEVSPRWMDRHGQATLLVGHATVAVFVVEIGLRLYAHGTRFFRGGWNVFDLLVVLVALVPGGGAYSVFRVLRVLRVLRLLSAVRSMRIVVAALVRTVPGMASIGALLAMTIYIFSVMATQLFADADPERFGSLGTSLLSMFQITTGDDWGNLVRPVAEEHPAAWVFFIVFILLASYIVLNLFIAVAVEALDRESDESIEDTTEEVVDESTSAILAAIAGLRADVAALERRLPGADAGATGGEAAGAQDAPGS